MNFVMVNDAIIKLISRSDKISGRVVLFAEDHLTIS